MKLTVLICTHNRIKLLERVLASLNSAQRPNDHEITIMVAANACTDGTHVFLDDYVQQAESLGWLLLSWFAEPTPGKSFAINAAIPRMESGSLMAFVDDDHRVDNDFLVALCKAVDENPDASMFCGRIIPDWDGSEPAWVHDDGLYKIYPLPIPRQDFGLESRQITIDSGLLPGGGNLFIRTEVFGDVGGFSSELGPKGHDLGGGEDSAFILKALRNGQHFHYDPDIVQYHFVDLERLRLGYLMKKSFQRSQAAIRVHGSNDGILPRYLWRKLLTYCFCAITSLRWHKIRFYLVRIAAVSGEISGHLKSGSTSP